MRNNKYSDWKIVAQTAKLDSFRRGEITAPVYVRVKPINKCNHACRWCVYKADRREDAAAMEPVESGMHTEMNEADMIPAPKMMEILSDFKAMGVKAVTYSGGGEPLLYPYIVSVLRRTLDYGIDLSIITNGQLLAGERAQLLGFARWVRVSMDYTTGEQMAHSRVVPARLFDQVLANLQTFAASKQPFCDLEVNYIVHRDNCDGLVEFAARLFKLGVENIRFSPMYCPDFEAYHAPIRDKVEAQLRQIQEGLNTVAGESPKLSVNSTYNLTSPGFKPERAYTKCFFMQTVPVIGADQVVYACHNKAYDATGVIGSIRDQSFRDMWFSAEAKAVFDGLNPKCVCNHQCANDTKNHNIMALLNQSADNFV